MLLNDSNYLLIGGTGLLGTAFRKLLDKTKTQYTTASRSGESNTNHVHLDICNIGEVRQHLENNQYSHIVNFSGQTQGPAGELIETNVLGPINLLEVALELKVHARITLIGSAAEYGEAGSNPIGEDKTLEPKSIYGLSKQLQSNLVTFYARSGVNVNLARVFNVLDDNAPASSLPGKLTKGINDIQTGRSQVIELGPLSGVRDYLDSSAIAEMIFLVNDKGEMGEFYNVGSGIPTSNREFVHDSLEKAGLSQNVVVEQDLGPLHTGISVSYADVSKILSLSTKTINNYFVGENQS
jgi:nucleoside-diphosphate-sugar epimerase